MKYKQIQIKTNQRAIKQQIIKQLITNIILNTNKYKYKPTRKQQNN